MSPSWDTFFRTLSLADHNTRVVVAGTTMLGIAAGVVGTFAYLRRRALMGDALSHATLPGVAAVFIIFGSKHLPLLLLGATLSGVLGVLAVLGLRRVPRIKEDAAIGIVLSVFFGAGMVLFSIVQQMRTGQEAGLLTFIYGKAAAMLTRDAWIIAGTAGAVLVGSIALFKEFRVICFDQDFAQSQGTPVFVLDVAMMALVVMTTVVGLQAVGLILVVALLIIPPAAARFWTDDLALMTVLAGAFGALSGWSGATLSALMPRLPTGAVIVLCAGGAFLVSMLGAPHRGVIASVLRQWSLRRKIAYQHLLRALAEMEEAALGPAPAGVGALERRRGWTRRQLHEVIRRAVRREAVAWAGPDALRLTASGRVEATRMLRNHRLWEMYLIKYADIAPSRVDRDADEVEHVLSEPIVRELEQALDAARAIPPSPHPQEAPAT